MLETLQTMGPMLIGIWALTIGSVLLWPQHFRNSFLLLFALMMTMIFAAGCLGESGPTFLVVCFLLVMLALLLVPLLLVVNGVQLLRRED